ncbi:hypothetical protein, partial [Micrococcus sp.]|uniref:hypothetical protein n=1 Tax=Micrococcus sp. TaxID=1271 RepID=UPI0026DC9557
ASQGVPLILVEVYRTVLGMRKDAREGKDLPSAASPESAEEPGEGGSPLGKSEDDDAAAHLTPTRAEQPRRRSVQLLEENSREDTRLDEAPVIATELLPETAAPLHPLEGAEGASLDRVRGSEGPASTADQENPDPQSAPRRARQAAPVTPRAPRRAARRSGESPVL